MLYVAPPDVHGNEYKKMQNTIHFVLFVERLHKGYIRNNKYNPRCAFELNLTKTNGILQDRYLFRGNILGLFQTQRGKNNRLIKALSKFYITAVIKNNLATSSLEWP